MFFHSLYFNRESFFTRRCIFFSRSRKFLSRNLREKTSFAKVYALDFAISPLISAPTVVNCIIGIENSTSLFYAKSRNLIGTGGIDLLAILQRAWIERYFYTILYARFDRVALELRSQLCTLENSTHFNEISFDPHLF